MDLQPIHLDRLPQLWEHLATDVDRAHQMYHDDAAPAWRGPRRAISTPRRRIEVRLHCIPISYQDNDP